MSEPWYKDGIKFQCQGSGKCCISRGEYGYVYLTLKDRQKIAKLLGMTTLAFTKAHCSVAEDGLFYLKQKSENSECMFLENNRCTIYSARPAQCSTWPFWPEVMDAKTWRKEVASFCPGVGKGKTVSYEEIQEQIAIHDKWESEL